MSQSSKKPLALAIGTAFAASMAISSVNAAPASDGNPFAMSDLSSGYMQLAKEALTIEPSNRYAYLLLGDVYQRRAIIARNQWVKDKSTKNCSILNNAMSYFKSAISYYTKAKPDAQCTQYCNNEITRASNLIEELEEDKWFYCKGGS